MKANPNFVQDTITAAETYYRARAQSHVQEFVDSNRDTLFGEIANLVSSLILITFTKRRMKHNSTKI